MAESNGAARPRVLVAGVGNVLRGDDGFGPAVVRALERAGALPPGVRLIEVGIGVMGLVHELLEGCDALVVVDAVDRGDEPGSLHLLEPDVPPPESTPETERGALALDLHEVVPASVLLLASAIGVLPPVVRIVGCQPESTEDLSLELGPAVQAAVPVAVELIRRLVWQLGGGASLGGAP